MSTKQEIEAELRASYLDKALAELARTIREAREFDAALRAVEKQVWQPEWSFDDPLADRLARVGLGGESIRKLQALLDFLTGTGTDNAVPPEIAQRMAEMKSDETSALRQLADVVSDARRKR